MFKKISLCFFSTTLSLFISIFAIEGYYQFKWKKEFGSGWVDIGTKYDSHLGWKNISSFHHKNDWGMITHNKYGFRSETYAPSKDQIVILGDSVGWGYGVSDEETISAQLQKKLDRETIQVTNLSVTGYGPDQILLSLKQNLKNFKNLRHVILILNAENDLLDVGSNSRYGKSKPLFVYEHGKLKLAHKARSKFSLRNLFTRSILLRKIYETFPAIQSKFNKLAGDIELSEKDAQLIFRGLLIEIEKLSTRSGAKLHILNSPSLLDFKERPETYAWADQLIKTLKMDNIPVFSSLASEFPNLSTAYYDLEHYSPRGSEFIAEMIFRSLLSS